MARGVRECLPYGINVDGNAFAFFGREYQRLGPWQFTPTSLAENRLRPLAHGHGRDGGFQEHANGTKTIFLYYDGNHPQRNEENFLDWTDKLKRLLKWRTNSAYAKSVNNYRIDELRTYLKMSDDEKYQKLRNPGTQ